MIRKVYETVDKKMYPFNLRKVGRKKHIYYTADGNDSFIRWHNKRVYVSAFMGLTYPVFYEDERGQHGYLSGCITLCNWGGVYVEIVDGESVQLWEEV